MTEKKTSRWKPGESGNPKGRAKGVGKVGALRASIAAHVPDIIAALALMAKSGDSQAARILLERVLSPVKATEEAVALRLPAGGTLTAKANAVMTAAADGTIAPGQAAQLITALGTLAKIYETTELADRIAALELLVTEGERN